MKKFLLCMLILLMIPSLVFAQRPGFRRGNVRAYQADFDSMFVTGQTYFGGEVHLDEELHIDNDATGLAAGEHRNVIDMVIDGAGSNAASELHGYDFEITPGTSAGDFIAVGVHPGAGVIHQHTGSAVDVEGALKAFAAGSDTTNIEAAVKSSSNDATLFENQNDAIFIGHTSMFDEIQITLNTAANISIKPTFWFSLDGFNQWTQFIPNDGTEGFTQDGTILFVAGDLASWAIEEYGETAPASGGGDMYWIKIITTRATAALSTKPVENTIQVLSPVLWEWDESGDVTIHMITQHDGTEPAWDHSPTGLAIEDISEFDDIVYFDNTIYNSYTESSNSVYTTVTDSRWNSGADVPAGGGFGLHGKGYINHTVQNVVGTRGVLYFDGLANGSETVNQGRGIEGAINLDTTYGMEVSDDISAIGGYLGPYNAADNTSVSPGQATISVVDLVYLLETDMSLDTHGIRLVAKSTSAGVKMDYGFRIVNQGVTTANIFLENEDKDHTAVTNDIMMTGVAGDVVNGINMSGAVYSGSDIILQGGATISEKVGGTIAFGGNITVSGTATIDGTTIISDGTPHDLSDGEYTGRTVVLLAHETLAFGELVYIDSDGECALADADAAGTLPPGRRYMALAVIQADNFGLFLVEGFVCESSWTTVDTKGAAVYASVTAGGITTSFPASGKQVQVLGTVHRVDIIDFKPSNDVGEAP